MRWTVKSHKQMEVNMKATLNSIEGTTLLCATLLLTCCAQSPIHDLSGKPLPALGKEVRLVEKHGWLPKDEQALAELMTLPKIITLEMSDEEARRRISEALAKNAEKLISEGRVLQLKPGTKARLLGYYGGKINGYRPIGQNERTASWLKVEILEGDGKQQTGFTNADGIE